MIFGRIVDQVRMKLDGQVYAVKRIRLNPASRQFNKEKITNEVNLLSRLQHENIVRFLYAQIHQNVWAGSTLGDGLEFSCCLHFSYVCVVHAASVCRLSQ